jgi:hypothetical protein
LKTTPRQPTQVFVVKRGDYILGTTPDERWAKAIAGVNQREQSGVTIEWSGLEAAELRLKEQRRALTAKRRIPPTRFNDDFFTQAGRSIDSGANGRE